MEFIKIKNIGGLMNKNIIIIGTPRSGKTTLAKKLLEEFNYVYIEADSIREKEFEISKNEETEKCYIDIQKTEEKSEQKISKMMKDTCKNTEVILEDFSLTIEKAIELYGNENNLIYCLGTCDLSPEEMLEKIRKNDTKFEWSYHMGNNTLLYACDIWISSSKENKEKCRKYHNIKYYDTSKNREKVLNEIVQDIKEVQFMI